MPNPTPENTHLTAQELAADYEDDVNDFTEPHVHRWNTAVDIDDDGFERVFAICEIQGCQRLLERDQIETVLNQHAQGALYP